MRRFLKLAFGFSCAAIACVGFFACDDDPVVGAKSDAGGQDTSVLDVVTKDSTGTTDSPAEGGGACSSITNTTPTKDFEIVGSSAPAPTGGTITDGTYYLQTSTGYSGSGLTLHIPAFENGVYKFTGNRYEFIFTIPPGGQGPPAENSSGTFSATGTQVTFSRTCPAPREAGPLDYGYTATSISIKLYYQITSGGITITAEDVYTKLCGATYCVPEAGPNDSGSDAPSDASNEGG